MTDKDLNDPKAILESQLNRIGGEVFVMPYQSSEFVKLAELLQAKGFVVVPKNAVTRQTVYKTPQALLVLDHPIRVMNKASVERIICYSTDNGKIVGNFDLQTLGL